MLGEAGSIRRQIILGTSILLGLTLVLTLLVVTVVQQNSTASSLEHVEKSIIANMDRGGKILSQSHGLIMATLMDDNAFGDVQSLVSRAVADDRGLLYGLVVDTDEKVWAFAHPKNDSGAPEDSDETLAQEIDAMGEPGGMRREIKFDNASIIEYSAIIEMDDEATGYVRYGFDKQQVEKALVQEQERLDSQLNSVLSALVVVALLGLVLGTLGSGRLAHQISGPLHEVVDTVKDIAEGEGDLTKRIDAEGAGEIGELAMWFNTFLNHLQELIRGVGETTMNLADASGNLTDTSASMTENAATTSEQASQVNASASLVSESSQNAAAAAEEMQATIGEIARNANQAADVAMMGVQTVSDANQTVEKLGESSADIGKIINVITSIAEQTNLLALNATIEAARAGDAGKGFAVVASEVKDLAGETGKATTEISNRIETIQKDALEAMTAIGHISAVINEINELQSSIAASVEQQSQTMVTMTQSVHGAAEASTAIAQNIGIVADTAASTMSGAEEAGNASESLREISFKMDDLIERFKYE